MNRFVISDTHWGHLNICKFLRADGVTKLRPWDTAEEMDADMIERWNAVVKPTDKVYHLGDVVINRQHLKTMAKLNGKKVLIRGNHDIFKLNDYTEYFYDVRGCYVTDGIIMSHIPVHTDCKGRFDGNIHGHTHATFVMKDGTTEIDPWYQNVCVENTNYTPIALDVVLDRFKNAY